MKHIFSVTVVIVSGAVMVQSLTREMSQEIRIVTGIIRIAAIGVWGMLNLIWYGIRKNYGTMREDERTQAIFDSSARNAFMITWLVMFVILGFGTLDAGSLLVVVVSGLTVFGISYYVQLFRGS